MMKFQGEFSEDSQEKPLKKFLGYELKNSKDSVIPELLLQIPVGVLATHLWKNPFENFSKKFSDELLEVS